MATIDTLEIELQANTKSVNSALDNLTKKLNSLNASLQNLDSHSLNILSMGIEELATSFTYYRNSGINQSHFTSVSKGLEKLSTVDANKIGNVASCINELGQSFSQMVSIATSTEAINNLFKSIRSLGGVSVERAIVNLPRLSQALTQLLEELSTVPELRQDIVAMTNALANLSAQGSKVGSAVNSLSKDTKQYSRNVQTARTKTLSLAAAFGRFYATYFLVIRGVKAMWKGIKSSMDYVETFNYFNVTIDRIGQSMTNDYERFGYDSAEAYDNAFQKRLGTLNSQLTGYTLGESGELIWSNLSNLGIDSNQLMNFQARLGAVTNSVGMLGETSSYTQQAFSMLATDMSSFTNQDLSNVMNDLNSALIGQSRAMYKYGVDITNASLAEYAQANGITKKVSAMSQQEKMQLRILAILDQTKIQWTDQIQTIGSVANQYRMLSQLTKNLGRVLGNLFLPIVKTVLPVINGLVIALTRLFETLGFSVYGDSWLKDLNEDASSGYQAVDDLDDVLDDTDDILGDANNNAKKLKKTLQGFDELNVLSSKEDTALTSIGTDIDLSGAIKLSLEEYQSAWDKAFENINNSAYVFADEIGKKLAPLQDLMTDIVNGDWAKLGTDLSNIIIDFNTILKDAIDNTNWEDVGKQIGSFLNGIKWKDVFTSGMDLIGSIMKGAAEAWWGLTKENPIAGVIAVSLLAKFLSGNIFKTLGLGVALDKGMASAITGLSFTNLAGAISAALIAANIGLEVGKEIGKNIFPDDAELYDNFGWKDVFSIPKETADFVKMEFENKVSKPLYNSIKRALGEYAYQEGDHVSSSGVLHGGSSESSRWKGSYKSRMIDPSSVIDESRITNLVIGGSYMGDVSTKDTSVENAINKTSNDTNEILKEISRKLDNQSSSVSPYELENFLYGIVQNKQKESTKRYGFGY